MAKRTKRSAPKKTTAAARSSAKSKPAQARKSKSPATPVGQRGISKHFDSGSSVLLFRGLRGKPVNVDKLLDGLLESGIIGGVRRDVGEELFAGHISRPMGAWGLVIRLAGQPWTYLVGDRLHYDWPRELASKLRLRVAGFFADGLMGRSITLAYQGDHLLVDHMELPFGQRDENSPPDQHYKKIESGSPIGGVFSGLFLRGPLLDGAWLKRQRNGRKAWQAIAVALDAYVPRIWHGHSEGVAELIAYSGRKLKPADIERVDLFTFGPPETMNASQASHDLAKAIDAGDAAAVRAAIAAGAGVEHLPDDDDSPLIRCLRLGRKGSMYDARYSHITRVQQLEVLKALLEGGANPDPPGESSAIGEIMEQIDHDDERTPIRLLAMLIEHGADPNAFCGGIFFAGSRPLYVAALRKKLAVVKFLLAHGADPSLQSANGKTPRQQLQPDVEADTTTGDDMIAMFGEMFEKIGGKETAEVFESYLDGKDEDGLGKTRRQQLKSDTDTKRSVADRIIALLTAAEQRHADTADWPTLADAAYQQCAAKTRAHRRQMWRDHPETMRATGGRHDTLDGDEPATVDGQ